MLLLLARSRPVTAVLPGFRYRLQGQPGSTSFPDEIAGGREGMREREETQAIEAQFFGMSATDPLDISVRGLR